MSSKKILITEKALEEIKEIIGHNKYFCNYYMNSCSNNDEDIHEFVIEFFEETTQRIKNLLDDAKRNSLELSGKYLRSIQLQREGLSKALNSMREHLVGFEKNLSIILRYNDSDVNVKKETIDIIHQTIQKLPIISGCIEVISAGIGGLEDKLRDDDEG
jgi:endonuclease IV